MKKLLNVIFIFLMIVMTVSCGGGKHMPPSAVSASKPNAPASESSTPGEQPSAEKGPAYDEDIQPIFKKYCSACHRPGSGLPDWLDYSQAYAKRNKIMENDVVKRIMPPKGAPQLQESDIAMIKEWIENGAPEKKNVGSANVQSAQPAKASIPDASAAEKTPTVEPIPQVPYPTLYCEQVEKYPSKKIMSNRILALSLPDDIKKSSIGLTTLLFAANESVASVENNILLRSTESEIEVCGVHIDNKKLCQIKSNVQNSLNMKMDVECTLEMPVKLQLRMVNGSLSIACYSGALDIAVQYDSCKTIPVK